MQVKKMLIGFATVAVLFSMMAGTMMPVSATGAKKVQFSVSEAAVKAGQTVVVEISVEGTDIAGLQGKLAYDEAAFTVEKAEGTQELDANAILTFHEDADKKIVDGRFAYASAAGKDMNGVILKYTFKATDIANGTYALTLEDLMVFDGKGKDIPLEAVKSGVLTATGGKAPAANPASGNEGTSSVPVGNNITTIIFIVAGVLVVGLLVILIIGARKKSQSKQ